MIPMRGDPGPRPARAHERCHRLASRRPRAPARPRRRPPPHHRAIRHGSGPGPNRSDAVGVDRGPRTRRSRPCCRQHDDLGAPAVKRLRRCRPSRRDGVEVCPDVRREQLEPGIHEVPRVGHRPLEPRAPRLRDEHPRPGATCVPKRERQARRRVRQQAHAPGQRVGRPPPRQREDDGDAQRRWRRPGWRGAGPASPGPRAGQRPSAADGASAAATTSTAPAGHQAAPRSVHAPSAVRPTSQRQSAQLSRARPRQATMAAPGPRGRTAPRSGSAATSAATRTPAR